MGTVGAKVESLAEKEAAARAPGEGGIEEDGPRADPGLVGVGREDVARVSVNGKEGVGGKAGDVTKRGVEAREVPGDGVFVDAKEDVSGCRNGGLEDFEMNGVSSLLKMKGSGRVFDIEVGSLASSVGVDKDAGGVKIAVSTPALAGGDASGVPDSGIKDKTLAVGENGETLADSAEEIGKISGSASEPADVEAEDVG